MRGARKKKDKIESGELQSYDIRSREFENFLPMKCPKCHRVAKFATVCADCLDELQKYHEKREESANREDLTPEQAESIMAMAAAGVGTHAISMHFEVSQSFVESVIHAGNKRDPAIGPLNRRFADLQKALMGDNDLRTERKGWTEERKKKICTSAHHKDVRF